MTNYTVQYAEDTRPAFIGYAVVKINWTVPEGMDTMLLLVGYATLILSSEQLFNVQSGCLLVTTASHTAMNTVARLMNRGIQAV